MRQHSIDCNHLAIVPSAELQLDPEPQETPAQMEVRIESLLERIESKHKRRLEAYLRKHESALKGGYETHSGSRKQATDYAWESTENLLNRVFNRLFEAEKFEVPLPTLSTNRSGSIDITWQTGGLHLLLNIPPEGDQKVEFSYSWESGSPQFGKVQLSEAHDVIFRVLVDL